MGPNPSKHSAKKSRSATSARTAWLVFATVVVLDVPLYQGWCVLSVNATVA